MTDAPSTDWSDSTEHAHSVCTDERVQAMLDLMPSGVYICDAEGRITMFNRRACEIWGRTPSLNDDAERFCGSFRVWTLEGELIARDRVPMAAAIREGAQFTNVEAIVEQPCGKRFVATITIEPLHDPDGSIIGAINVFQDVTEQKNGAMALRQSEELHRQLLQALPAAVYMCDANGRIRFFNDAAVELWGQTPSIGIDHWCGCWKIFRADGSPLPLDECPMAIALREGRSMCDVQIIIERPDGSRRDVLPHPVPIFDATGAIAGAINMLIDLTKERQAERAAIDRSARLTASLEASDTGTFRWDMRSNELDWDDSLNQLFALEPGETARSLDDFLALIHPDDRPQVIDQCERSRADGAQFEAEFRIVMPDGSTRWLYDRGTTFMEAGAPSYMIGACVDVTARRDAEAAMRDSANRLRLATDAAQLGTWDFNPQTGELIWDARCRTLFGLGPDEPINYERFLELLHPEDRDRANTAVAEALALANDGRFDIEYRVRPMNGEAERWIHATGRATRLDRKVVRFIGTVHDISPYKFAQIELEHHQKHLEDLVQQRTNELHESHKRLRVNERLASLGTLCAGLGHDMGNLLLPVRVRVETLEQADLSEEHREDVAAIKTSADYLQRLANGLRLMALDPERASDCEPSELSSWWNDAAQILRNAVPRTVRIEAEVVHRCRVAISRPALTQAVFNLVQNAGEALRGTKGGVVRISASVTEDHVVLQVSDNGPGMTAEVRERCMEPFFTTKPRQISTGLGLVLVSGLIREARGTVHIESAPGQGTTFTISLPRAPEVKGAPEDARPVAHVRVADRQLSAFIEAELRTLRCEVADEAAGNERCDLLVTDEQTAENGGGAPCPVISLTENGESALNGAVHIGARPGAHVIRQTLRKVIDALHAEDTEI